MDFDGEVSHGKTWGVLKEPGVWCTGVTGEEMEGKEDLEADPKIQRLF